MFVLGAISLFEPVTNRLRERFGKVGLRDVVLPDRLALVRRARLPQNNTLHLPEFTNYAYRKLRISSTGNNKLRQPERK